MRMAQLSHLFLEKVPLMWPNTLLLARELKVLGSTPQDAMRPRLVSPQGSGTWGLAAWREVRSPLTFLWVLISYCCVYHLHLIGVQQLPVCRVEAGKICLPSLGSEAWHLWVLQMKASRLECYPAQNLVQPPISFSGSTWGCDAGFHRESLAIWNAKNWTLPFPPPWSLTTLKHPGTYFRH